MSYAGRVTVVRPSKDEESPIDALKVSYYRCIALQAALCVFICSSVFDGVY